MGARPVSNSAAPDTSGISDGDGLTNASFSYHWHGDEADISGATSSAYPLIDADEGKTITVQVSFADDAGNDESLTSTATTAVAAATPEPTPPSESLAKHNRAPMVDEDAEWHTAFLTADWAPRGIYVSKVYEGIFSDPDGDTLTFIVSVPADRSGLVDTVYIHEDIQRVFIRMDADGDWGPSRRCFRTLCQRR